MTSFNNNFILDTSQSTKLCLYNYAVSMCILNNLFGYCDVVLERFGRSIDHNGSESAIDTGFTKLKAIAVIQMQSDRNIRILDNCCLYQFYKISVVSVSSCALGYLKDNRALQLSSCLSDTLNDLHVVYVESTNCIAAMISFFKHFSGCN